ncbi:hypothetical protein [Campylobacter jejuni]|uniref:hypothetical protein n=1 Tax=Campylobacter jejuni TaxID=197 RepID=UPI000F80FA7D|nr:hypothetical protein [Campylobacter jejuni]
MRAITAQYIQQYYLSSFTLNFGRVNRGAVTITNPAGKDALAYCYGKRIIGTGSGGSYGQDVYYNSFYSNGISLTGTGDSGYWFYLKRGQTVTCAQNYNANPSGCFCITTK